MIKSNEQKCGWNQTMNIANNKMLRLKLNKHINIAIPGSEYNFTPQ